MEIIVFLAVAVVLFAGWLILSARRRENKHRRRIRDRAGD